MTQLALTLMLLAAAAPPAEESPCPPALIEACAAQGPDWSSGFHGPECAPCPCPVFTAAGIPGDPDAPSSWGRGTNCGRKVHLSQEALGFEMHCREREVTP